ncbi:MAG TPA: CDP-archaeol synthase, partial [Dehalococcoidia bacterium]|nr:CDP-archaeol synthase [Dehalococcoidia bacterium]
RTETALHDWAVVAAGALYIGWLGAHAVLLRELDDGREWVLLAFGVVFATDTGAYFIGRAFGRRKMAPRVSPGKTWAGGVGGFACGAIVAAVLNFAFGLDAPPWEIAGLAIIVPVTAEIGDLAESVLKRSMHVKDMGKVMPGHGGIVDRLDSLLFAIPVLYYWVRWVIQ